MSRTKHVLSLKKITAVQENQIERKLGAIVSLYEYEKSKLMELISYRKEYEDRLRGSFDKGIPAQQAQQQRLFITQLSQGIERQQELLLKLNKEINEKMYDWKLSHLKSKAVGATLGRYQHLDMLKENKREQQVQDDRIRSHTR